jgi:ABC-type phosphate transport system substrate-binding protein
MGAYKMKKIVKVLISCSAAFCVHSAYAQVAVVVGAKSDVPTLTSEQVSAVYLGKSDKFPNGSTALPLDQTAGSAVRGTFYDKVTGKSEAQVKAAWSRLVFSGKGTPPKEVASSAEVKKLVGTNPNTIGYIEKSAVDSSVKVVFSAD